MEIVITQWALDSYLELKHAGEFSRTDFSAVVRPDVLLLLQYPEHPRFANGKFWSQATLEGNPLPADLR